jgi:hypothetical protein
LPFEAVTVIVASPAARPVTMPAVLTVAMEEALLVQTSVASSTGWPQASSA